MSFFDTVVIPMFSPPEPVREPKSGRQVIEEIRACQTVEDVEAWIEANDYRRKHDAR